MNAGSGTSDQRIRFTPKVDSSQSGVHEPPLRTNISQTLSFMPVCGVVNKFVDGLCTFKLLIHRKLGCRMLCVLRRPLQLRNHIFTRERKRYRDRSADGPLGAGSGSGAVSRRTAVRAAWQHAVLTAGRIGGWFASPLGRRPSAGGSVRQRDRSGSTRAPA
jgi:hypothetical protein